MNLWKRLPLRLSLSTIAACVVTANPIFACSLSPDYKGPETNFELVQQADVIFVGTLVKSLGKDEFERSILVKPSLLLKGSMLPEAVKIRGYLSDRTLKIPDKEYRVVANSSEPFDLWRPHPEVWIGGCTRQSFNQGMQVVLLFTKNGDKLEWYDPPFTRSSEDVSGPNALWVQAIKTYVRIGRLSPEKQRAALRTEMLNLRKDSFGDRGRTLLADDIERHLAGVGPLSDFGYSAGTPNEARWLHNIVNETYHARVLPPEEVRTSRAGNPFRKFLWSAAALLAIVALFGSAAFLQHKMKRKK